ncbi:MAG: HAD family hydrolase [bacterium]|nr:HAD family hydrolase [bacterium]
MVKAIIFDVDGVLADSIDAVTKFNQDILEAIGYPIPTPAHVRAVFHLPRPEVLRALMGTVSDEEVSRALSVADTVPYPQYLMKTGNAVKKVVEELSATYPLGVATSKYRKTTEAYLEHADLRHFFDTVVTFEDTAEHKPHPEPLMCAASKLGFAPHECVYIGDSNSDIAAARACAMKIIGYSDTATAYADSHTDTFTDIPRLIELL